MTHEEAYTCPKCGGTYYRTPDTTMIGRYHKVECKACNTQWIIQFISVGPAFHEPFAIYLRQG